MTKRELIINTLTEIGYNPTIDEDGDVAFKCQKKSLVVEHVNEDDDNFLVVLMPAIAAINEGEELLYYAVCNKMNRNIRVVKHIITEEMKYVVLTYEMVYTDESLKMQLENAIGNLIGARNQFAQTVAEYKQELNNNEKE